MTLFFAQRNASSGRQGAVAVGESFSQALSTVLFSPSSWRILHARCLVTRSAGWHGLPGPPPHCPAARPRRGGRLPGPDEPVQSRSRLAVAGLLAIAPGCDATAGAAGTTAKIAQRAHVRLVSAGTATHVGYRTRCHRSRHSLVGRRTVQRPPGLGQTAGLPQGATERGGASLSRRPHRRTLRHGQRLADRPANGL